MLLKLNARTNKGYLYHFTDSWEHLEEIVDDGLDPTKGDPETTWENSKKIVKYQEDDGEQQALANYVSLSRNPSSVYTLKDETWRYGVVIDSNRLSDNYILKPYYWAYRPTKEGSIVDITMDFGIYRDKDNNYSLRYGHYLEKKVSLTKKEGEEIIRWIKATPWVDAESYELEEWDSPYIDDKQVVFSISLGGSEAERSRIGKVPRVLDKFIRSATNMSEERLYPRKKDRLEDDEGGYMQFIPFLTQDSIVGILIPDTEYFTSELLEFEIRHPDLKTWIYPDPLADEQSRKTVKEFLRVNPEVRQLYRLPR